MQKPITSGAIVAYTHCPREAFLLLCTDEHGTPHDYPRLLAQQQRVNQSGYVERLKQQYPEAMAYPGRLPRAGRSMLLAATLRVQDLEADCAVLTPAARSTAGHGSGGRSPVYEPTLVAGTHTMSEDQRLELVFGGFVLGQLQQVRPASGRIIGSGWAGPPRTAGQGLRPA